MKRSRDKASKPRDTSRKLDDKELARTTGGTDEHPGSDQIDPFALPDRS